MRISDEQKAILDSLVVERLRDNLAENASLVNTFSSKQNPTLERIIRSRYSFDRDIAGTTAYYIVKAPGGELLLYFSLKCGELFEDLDHRKMELAAKTQNAVTILLNKTSYPEDKVTAAESFINDNLDEINALLPDIGKYLKKKGQYTDDINKELNKQIRRVLKTYPAIEIVEFCKNDNAKNSWEALGIKRKMGECIFWHKIVPKLKAIQDITGCQYVYLFAADKSYDGELANYYKVALHFDQSAILGANKPQYDFDCFFLCQEMKYLPERQEFFYDHFNPDPEGDDLV